MTTVVSVLSGILTVSAFKKSVIMRVSELF
jgi:hypothetical protein